MGAEGLDLGAQVIAGALLGVLISAALWWASLEIVALVAERRMRAAAPGGQTHMARDCVALYLLAHIAFRLRNVGTLNRERLIAAALLLALWPVATSVDALVALPLVAAVLAVLVGFEAVRFREARARIRTAP